MFQSWLWTSRKNSLLIPGRIWFPPVKWFRFRQVFIGRWGKLHTGHFTSDRLQSRFHGRKLAWAALFSFLVRVPGFGPLIFKRSRTRRKPCAGSLSPLLCRAPVWAWRWQTPRKRETSGLYLCCISIAATFFATVWTNGRRRHNFTMLDQTGLAHNPPAGAKNWSQAGIGLERVLDLRRTGDAVYLGWVPALPTDSTALVGR